MLQVRRHDSLSGGDHGWLKAKHHFKVMPQGDPAHHALGALVVWNDDEIAPGTGFGLHGHRDMEIISYVREGAVTHRDTVRSEGVTWAGDVQVMSAGAGIRHAEHNDSRTPLRLFQIWLLPRTPAGARGGRPGPFQRPTAPARSSPWPAATHAKPTPCRSEPTPGCSALRCGPAMW
jgi:redox-sensitive bicupin YhaK (pirin superfamily)